MAKTFFNWNHSVESKPREVRTAHTLDELVEIVRTPATCPSPIRVAGNRHSTTECFVTTGTQVFLDEEEFGKKCELSPDQKTLTVGAGVTMLKIANFLQRHELQLAVMPEVGNATAGSVACCGTKDSSFDNSPSQVSSTVIAVKMVKADGTIESVDARNGANAAARMRLIRSSYGLLGIIYEVTFKTEPLAVARYTYEILPLTPLPSLATLRDGANSILGFMQPYDDQILVERRTLVTNTKPTPEDWVKRKARSSTWRFGAAEIADSTSKAVKAASLISKIEPHFKDFTSSKSAAVLHELRVAIVQSLKATLDDFLASRTDCMINFREAEPYFDFTFWAFPVHKWEPLVSQYLKFVRQYEKDTGFQKSLFTEIYFISKDEASFLTFSPDEDIFTLDMVHHDANDRQWREMNQQFNVFAAKHGGLPLLNQTKELTTSPQVAGKSVVQDTLGNRWLEFLATVHAEDPDGRFMNDFFQKL
jgi:FAD binding domain-containing protein